MLNTGDKVNVRTLTTIEGTAVALPAADRLVHLQFRRFAGCPICSLHMHEVASRHNEITKAGVTEVVVFHSSAKAASPLPGRPALRCCGRSRAQALPRVRRA